MAIRTIGQPAGIAIPSAGNVHTSGLGPDGLSPIYWGGGWPLGADDTEEQYAYWRQPQSFKTTGGVFLSFCDIRDGFADFDTVGIVIRHWSGTAWGDAITIYEDVPATEADRVQVHHAGTWEDGDGNLRCMFVTNPKSLTDAGGGDGPATPALQVPRAYVTKSTDGGYTWGTPVEKPSLIVTGPDSPSGQPFYNGANCEWTQFIPGPEGILYRPAGFDLDHVGLGFYYRMENHTTGANSFFGYAESTDGGDNWSLIGGPTVSISDPDNRVTEPMGVMFDADNLYVQCRQSESTDGRDYTTSSDGGVTWTDIATHTELVSPRVKAGLCLAANGDLWCTFPSDTADHRKGLFVSRSTDNGATWETPKRLRGGWGAYSTITEISRDKFVVITEEGVQSDADSSEAHNSWGRGVGHLVFTKAFYEDDTAVFYTDLQFNEEPDGTEPPGMDAVGPSIYDHGPYGMHAIPQGADLEYESIDGDIWLTITDGYVREGNAKDKVLDEFTTSDSFGYQCLIKTTDTSAVIRDNGEITLSLDGSGKLVFELTDQSANNPTITSTAAVNDGVKHSVACWRDTEEGKLYLYVDTVEAATPVTDTTDDDLGNDLATRIGQDAAGSNQWVGSIARSQFYHRALLPSELKTASQLLAERTTPSWVNITTPSTGPGALSSCKFWLPSLTGDTAGQFFRQQSRDYPVDGPYYGNHARSCYSYGERIFCSTPHSASEDAQTRSMAYVEDANLGAVWRQSSNSSYATQSGMIARGTASADWLRGIHNDGVGTIFLWMILRSGANATICDSLGTGTDGFKWFHRPDGTWRIYGKKNDSDFIGNAGAGSATPTNWTFYAIVLNGFGSDFQYYHGEYGDSTPTKVELSHTTYSFADPGGGDTDASNDLAFGGNYGSSSQLGGDIKDVGICNAGLSQSEINALFTATKE